MPRLRKIDLEKVQASLNAAESQFRLQSYAASILSVSNVQLAESDFHPL
jgi:hypothetical protein